MEKLIFGGQALGRAGGKTALVWNALPGEEVEIEVIKNHKDYLEGIACKILKASPHRLPPLEDHFLSCSPWQILAYEEENRWKKKIAEEIYRRSLNLSDLPGFEIIFSPEMYHYRNKMEFNFTQDGSGRISLAFFRRGGKSKIPAAGCQLAEDVINRAAAYLVDWLNRQQVPPQGLKSLVVRSGGGAAIAGLFLREEFVFQSYPPLNADLAGLQIYLSNPQSPAAVAGRALHQEGRDFLPAELKGVELRYGLLSFFQVHLPLFEKVLEDIAPFLDSQRTLLDFYAGVGAISLPFKGSCREGILVDSSPESLRYAALNIENNGLKHYRAILAAAEKMPALINSESVVVFDPPRPGLHRRVIKRVLEEKPWRIIYLSCNLSTQVRDLEKLQEAYRVKFLRVYNFFPRTPHIEGLCVLERG